MKDERTPEQKYNDWVRAVNICHAKGWMCCGGWAFQSPSGSIHDLSCADLDKLDDIEKQGHFLTAKAK